MLTCVEFILGMVQSILLYGNGTIAKLYNTLIVKSRPGAADYLMVPGLRLEEQK